MTRFAGPWLLLAVAAAMVAQALGLTSDTVGVYTWREVGNCIGEGFFPVDTEPECEAAGRALFNFANGCVECNTDLKDATEGTSADAPRGCWKTAADDAGTLHWSPNGDASYDNSVLGVEKHAQHRDGPARAYVRARGCRELRRRRAQLARERDSL